LSRLAADYLPGRSRLASTSNCAAAAASRESPWSGFAHRQSAGLAVIQLLEVDHRDQVVKLLDQRRFGVALERAEDQAAVRAGMFKVGRHGGRLLIDKRIGLAHHQPRCAGANMPRLCGTVDELGAVDLGSVNDLGAGRLLFTAEERSANRSDCKLFSGIPPPEK